MLLILPPGELLERCLGRDGELLHCEIPPQLVLLFTFQIPDIIIAFLLKYSPFINTLQFLSTVRKT
ncbi:hypothetical protein E2C01_000343 [Portunus trituberculatus]|uniref:Uncharacterized protein n=1 Tax=Portunus trituberculatus TaxID=210409 RepID=A0A5B7CGZ9_PORTR|nr:hypothetical protein [Portunus trituberculatus]